MCVCEIVIQEKIVKILTKCRNLLLKQVLGTDELTAYLHKYRIELDPHLAALVGRYWFFPLVFLHLFVMRKLYFFFLEISLGLAGNHGQNLLMLTISI